MSAEILQKIQRKTRTSDQFSLFEIEQDWRESWWGMPEFSMQDASPQHRITINFLTQDALVKDVLNADAHTINLVRVRWPNPTTGGADLVLAKEALRDLVKGAMVGGNHVSVCAYSQPRNVNTASAEPIKFFKEHLKVNHDPVSNDGNDAGAQNS